MLGERAAKNHHLISLSKTTLKWQTEDLADDVTLLFLFDSEKWENKFDRQVESLKTWGLWGKNNKRGPSL
jgi:hypothetical protein